MALFFFHRVFRMPRSKRDAEKDKELSEEDDYDEEYDYEGEEA